ncbi:FG-GAP-like repeat-containing protein [Actinomycetes bacterium KLBMP 9797]
MYQTPRSVALLAALWLMVAMTPTPAAAAPTAPAADVSRWAALQRDLRQTDDQVRIRLTTEATAPSRERRLRAQLGASFGGAWLTADGSELVAGVTDASAGALVRAAGARPQVVRHSERDLNAAKAALDLAAKSVPRTVSGWHVDLPTNSVVVFSDPTDLADARRFAARAATDPSTIRVVAAPERPRLYYDIRGGDPYFIGPSRCSAGFAVEGGFVTAGHCAALTSGQITGSNGVPMGTWGGYSFPGDDHAWVRTNADWTALPEAVGLGPVAGSQESVVGSSVCRSGSTTGVRCGTIQAKNETVIYPQGTVAGLTRTNACAQPGDSGGPFMTGAQAQGVTSGGSGNCSTGGTTYFQPVNEILAAYGLTLRVAGAFQQFVLHTPSAVEETDDTFDFDLADWDGDGRPDLVAIKRSNTGTGSTEVHIASGAANFQSFLLHTGTALEQTDGTFDFALTDWDRDGRPDLAAIKKSNTGTNSTEVHILSGASNFQTFLLQTPSAVEETDDTFDFDLADWDRDGQPDLVAIKKSNTGTGTTEVHIASGAANFQTFLLHTPTGVEETDHTFDFLLTDWNSDSQPDLVAVKKSNTGTGTTEVHIASGAANFQSFLLHTGTALEQTDGTFDFALTDWTGDGRPDLAAIKKSNTGTNTTEVHILGG